MSNPQDGSVAPTERVNIVYRPATDGAKEDVELPLKLLVTGDFTGAPDERPVEQREPINIDKDNFNEVLKGQNVKLAMKAPNVLSDDPEAQLSVNLNFESLKDFGPEAVADKIPELQTLVKMRDALTALKGPLANVPEFKKKLQTLIKDEKARDQVLKEVGIAGKEENNG